KFEYDLYTGNLSPTLNLINSATAVVLNNETYNNRYLFDYNSYITDSTFGTFLPAYSGMLTFGITRPNHEVNFYGTFPDETWVTIAIYIDYSTGHIYQEVPSMNRTIKT